MPAPYHGQTWNGSEPARALNSTAKSLRHWLDLPSGGQVNHPCFLAHEG